MTDKRQTIDRWEISMGHYRTNAHKKNMDIPYDRRKTKYTHMKSFFLSSFTYIIFFFYWSTSSAQINYNEVFQQSGWEVLFDGSSLDKWQTVREHATPTEGWRIEGEDLILASAGGDIITKKKYGNFVLKFDFMLDSASNSGVKYFVDYMKNSDNGKESIVGIEYQVIDDHNYPGPVADKVPNGLTAAAYLLYEPAGEKKFWGHGQWCTAMIISIDGNIEHWLNGEKVLAFDRKSTDFRDRVNQTKFKSFPKYGQIDKGYIMLQDHHDVITFRNILIKELD